MLPVEYINNSMSEQSVTENDVKSQTILYTSNIVLLQIETFPTRFFNTMTKREKILNLRAQAAATYIYKGASSIFGFIQNIFNDPNFSMTLYTFD